MTEKKSMTVGGLIWKAVMVVVALWLIVWLLRGSGINLI